MKALDVCVFALIAFFNLIIALEIPQSSTIDGNVVPFNMTTPECNPSFIMPSSSSSSTKTKRKEDGKFQATKVARKPPTESAIAKAKAKLYKVKKQKPKPKVIPRPCKYPGSRPCITQKEIDQGWHDVDGCFNENLFLLGIGPTHCWDAGDDCVKADCRY
ncbi:hypothetical protein BOTCAL_0306g00100 [Botryotinia calthae]|uniref:Secreted protein n=1 Tax=Botryotinia calthae TaxID=38488 RepID=A0A4Y8CUS6_9HELO|nr:hypothetical protein BOTCAL_0306g00100 [Botryotinia calthae]